jgi:DNA-binding MarR family transcriptional regulator
VSDQDEHDATDLTAAFDAVVRANASLVGQLSARAGVHESGLRALVLISDTGYSTPTEVAGFLGLTSGAVTNMVDRLSTAGLLERTPNPTDRRGSLLRLRPAGEAVVADYRERYAAMLGAATCTRSSTTWRPACSSRPRRPPPLRTSPARPDLHDGRSGGR